MAKKNTNKTKKVDAKKAAENKTAAMEKQISVVPVRAAARRGALTPGKIVKALAALDDGAFFDAANIFGEMLEKYIHLGSVMDTRVSAVNDLEYDIFPGVANRDDEKTDPKAKKIADEFAKVFWNIPNRAQAFGAMLVNGVGFGASLVDIEWLPNPAGIKIGKLTPLACRGLTFYDKANPATLLDFPRWRTKDEPEGMEIPRQRYMYHTPLVRDNHPVTSGLFRGIVWLYIFQNFTTQDWMSFLELYGVPMRVGKYGSSATEPDKEALRDAVMNLGSDAAAVISEDTLIEIIETKTSGKVNFGDLIQRFDNLVSKRIIGQTLTTEQQGSSSSLAMSEVHERQFASITISDARAIAETFNADVIKPWVNWTFGEQEVYPTLKFMTDDNVNVEATLANVAALETLGYTVTQEHLEKTTGLPLIPIGDNQSQTKTTTALTTTTDGKPGNKNVDEPNSKKTELKNELDLMSRDHFTIGVADDLYAQAYDRIELGLESLIGTIEDRVKDDGENIEPLSDSEIKTLGLTHALANIGINGALAGEASVLTEILEITKQHASEILLPNSMTFLNEIKVDQNLIPDMMLRPVEAEKWWVKKLVKNPDVFAKLLGHEKQGAFAIAKNYDLEAVEALKQLFKKALATDNKLLTFREWFKEANKIKKLKFLNRNHANTVFRNNLQSAYGAQRYRAYRGEYAKKIFKVFTVVTVDDEARSLICDNLNGLTLPTTHAFWKNNWNPFHHKCRSTVVAKTKWDKYTVTKTVPQKAELAEGFGNPAHARFGMVLADGGYF